IHRLTFGIPRLINTLCDTALTACMVDVGHRVDLEVIDNVVHELRWQWFEDKNPKQENPSSAATSGKSSDGHVNLMVYRAGELLQQVSTSTFPFVIGRSNANDLVIIDKEVSRRHALIDCIGGIYVIEDLNSRNGILVNQKPRGRALLRSGDVIGFGGVDVVFYLERQHETRPRSELMEKATADSVEDTGQRTTITNIGSQALG
ncbi:MAG: FHA domain-containing protein, partial [Gammaproteobacteria bacterium]|nr:FHA domain-containing protein [Gammaproteobacteria bacterium]